MSKNYWLKQIFLMIDSIISETKIIKYILIEEDLGYKMMHFYWKNLIAKIADISIGFRKLSIEIQV